MWRTSSRVAYRNFLGDFKQGDIYKNAESGCWERDKSLVYDGQQRLQTLYSCLNHTFNERVLVFDLSYDWNKDEDGNTGFRFIDKNNEEQLESFDIKLNTLFLGSEKTEQKALLQSKYIERANGDSNLILKIMRNLDCLWSVFVDRSVTPLAYFSIASEDESKVNEIFERLNTGGMTLSKADLLFYKIKAEYPDFEANIMQFSKELFNRSKIGFESYDILQILHMIVKGRSRIDENVDNQQILAFKAAWDNLQAPLTAFFSDYLHNRFHITNMSIIRNKVPLLVLAIFFYEYYRSGRQFKNLDAGNLKLIDKFFITSEINDWTLQSYADNFTRILKDNGNKQVFPYEDLEQFVKSKGNRWTEITENMFASYRWMGLKFLMPNRAFEFDLTMQNRFNPELDHIFPVHLNGMDQTYSSYVDIIWNMQPVKGEVNLMKTNIHPKDFFTDQATNSKTGEYITGSKYYNDYDFIPDDISHSDWDDYKIFISNRKEKMIKFLEDKYDIKLVLNKSEDIQTSDTNN